MTARALRGVDMFIAEARRHNPRAPFHVEGDRIIKNTPQPEAIPTIPFLVLNGLPRTGLTVKEVATISGHAIDRIRKAVRNGEIKADRTGQAAVIPVTELATIAAWADQ